MRRKIATITFFITLTLGFLIGMAIPIRPTQSEIEQRMLTEFPTANESSLADGSFFSNISLWYADSFPGREFLLSAEQKIKNLYGIKTDIMVVGNALNADEIPDFSEAESEEELVASADEEITLDEETIATAEETENESITEEETTYAEDLINITYDDATPPTAKAMDSEISKYVQQNLYVKDGAAYSAYYFNQKNATIYIEALNSAAEELDGIADVYSILVPNQSGVMLTEEEQQALGGSNQRKAIRYYYSQLKNVKAVETIDTLREHNDEYIYFRTDHHETALGGYYIYRSFCAAKGLEPHELSDFETIRYEPYLGSFYSTLQSSEMAANPDYVDAYIPMGTNDLTYWTTGGKEIEWSVVREAASWGKYSAYCCFVAGDKPLAIIENPEIQDGSSCLVLKESYANCFIPFLVDHYQTVYIMDFRYTKHDVVTYVKDNNIDDLMVVIPTYVVGTAMVK